MEDLPPTYDFAVSRDPWTLVAPWLPPSDLCSAALVCQKWHAVFAPVLWGNPTSHLSADDDAVLHNLTRFLAVLPKARPLIRRLIHTIHLPSAMPYNSEGRFWLDHALYILPNLQSLIVLQCTSFINQSFQTLQLQVAKSGTTYNLKLLLAEGLSDATSEGINEALKAFSKLVYLDLSYTPSARVPSVFSSIGNLLDLQVLKLRGMGLWDHDLLQLADIIGPRVRLLDVRDNHLTDDAVVYLSNSCFLHWESLWDGQAVGDDSNGDSLIGIQPGPDFLSLDSLRSEDLDRKLFQQLTRPLTGRFALEVIPHNGLTHIHLSGNPITYGNPRGLARMLRTNRIYVLDCGTLRPMPKNTTKDRSPLLVDAKDLHLCFTGNSSTSLTYLRVHFSILTCLKAQAEAKTEQSTISGAPTLSLTPPLVVDETPAPEYVMMDVEGSGKGSKGNQAYATESAPLCDLEAHLHESIHAPIFGNEDEQHYLCWSAAVTAQIERLNAQRPPTQGIATTSAADSVPLHPSHLPRLQTLILTSVPSSEYGTAKIAHSLKTFIIACSEEGQLAELQAQLKYPRTPGFPRGPLYRRYADSLFALKTITLEVDPSSSAMSSKRKAWDHSRAQTNMLRSSTGDVDSENLWAAAENDFSFFGEEGEHSEQDEDNIEPRGKSGQKIPTARVSDEEMDEPALDIVAELATFRKERKAAHQAALKEWRHGKGDREMMELGGEPFTPGHWKGAVKIVRNPVEEVSWMNPG